MLAQRLQRAGDVRQNVPYLVSEKYDGIRAAWDGKRHFWTRGGLKVRAPPAFSAALPPVPLDGELWAGRGRFDVAASLYQSPSDAGWLGRLQYRVFDMPGARGPFVETYRQLRALLPAACSSGSSSGNFRPPVCLAPQREAARMNVQSAFEDLVAAGAEGLMLRRADRPYRAGRSTDILKLKRVADAEAVVVGHVPGQGAQTGAMGALRVRWAAPNRQRAGTFKVGTGFSGQQRRNAQRLFPPGTRITVQYMELTQSGKPRHPVFKGVRTNM